MFAARTIGAVLTLLAAGLVAGGAWASRDADRSRRASLRGSGRTVGVFLCVWLLRDGVELALTREAWTTAHRVDLACVVAGALLAFGTIAVSLVPERSMDERTVRVVRRVLAGLASTCACVATARLFV